MPEKIDLNVNAKNERFGDTVQDNPLQRRRMAKKFYDVQMLDTIQIQLMEDVKITN